MTLDFSDTTNKDGIIQLCEDYCGLGDAGISGDSTLLKRFTSYTNRAMSQIWHEIFMSYGGWQYDDANQTDLPAATDTLTASQTSYALPSTALTVKGVEVKNEGGVWSELIPITEEQIKNRQAQGEFLKTAGTPKYYSLVGESVKIYPASNWTQAASFKVFFERGGVAFTSSDTTESPGFAGEYHDAVPIGASLFWLKSKRPSDPVKLEMEKDWAKYLKDIRSFYARRWRDKFPPRIMVSETAKV